jgi:hypothetical protein
MDYIKGGFEGPVHAIFEGDFAKMALPGMGKRYKILLRRFF